MTKAREHKTINLTKTYIEDLPLPATGRTVVYDREVSGLVLMVHAGGTKSFHVFKWLADSNQPVKPKIGRFPDMSIESARKAAIKLRAELNDGDNPLLVAKHDRNQITLGELIERYIEDYARHHCRTWEEARKNLQRCFGDWYHRQPRNITKGDLQRRINELGEVRGHHTANRVLDDLKAVLNWGLKYDHFIGLNPAMKIVRFKTQSRERFIKPQEFSAFFEGLRTEKNIDLRDYVYLSLFTGARQMNVLSMRWKDIDFDLGTWYIGRTKNGESQTIPLPALALQVLIDRHADRKSEDWVFPTRDLSSRYPHLSEPKKGWANFLERTKLKDLRMHDLRRYPESRIIPTLSRWSHEVTNLVAFNVVCSA